MEVFLFVGITALNTNFHATNAAVERIVESAHVLQLSNVHYFKAIFGVLSQNLANAILGEVAGGLDIGKGLERLVVGVLWCERHVRIIGDS